MKYYIEQGPDSSWVVLHVKGSLTVESVPLFEKAWHRAMELAPLAIGVNMSSIDFIDSIGVGACVQMMKTALSKKINFTLLDISEAVSTIFKASNLNDVFLISSCVSFICENRVAV